MSARHSSLSRSQLLEERAREMRSAPTLSEARLWSVLSGSQLGVACRRQVVIGEFIVDFLAPGPRLIVEVDGGYHDRRARADVRRDRVLERAGYRVLHVQAEGVVRDLLAVVAQIRAAL